MSNGKRANRRGCQKTHLIGQVVLTSLDEANGQTEGDDSSYEYLGTMHVYEWYIICSVVMMEETHNDDKRANRMEYHHSCDFTWIAKEWGAHA